MSRSGQAATEEDRLRISGHRLFRDLASDAREALIEGFQVEDVPADWTLLEEGQANSCLFIVLKGSVSVKLPTRAERVSEVKLATLGDGDFFGEYSFFDGQRVSATVYAVKPTRVAWLDKSALDAFVKGHAEAGRRFYASIARMLVGRLRAKDAELDVITIG